MMGRDESVLADLQGAYGGASHERKLQILESLTRIGSVESHSFLVGLLKESFPVLKIAAAAALIQILNR
jgi:Ser/Thr protein kinase RdoA (MazF antagonist)